MSDRGKHPARAARDKRSAELVADSIFDEQFAMQHVAKCGYVWKEIEGVRSIVPSIPSFLSPRLYGPELIAPAAMQGLFVRFANLKPAENSFLDFANQFGFLEFRERPLQGEPWTVLTEASRKVQQATRLWDSIVKVRQSDWVKQGDRTAKREHWQLVVPSGIQGEGEKFDKRYPHDEYENLTPATVADNFLQTWINEGLEGRMRVGVQWKHNRNKHAIVVTPTGLLGAMWQQLAQAFTGKSFIITCESCGGPIEIGPGAFTTKREYCSNACNQKAHRRKVREAKAMSKLGQDVEFIASQLNTTPAIIQNWLVKKK